MVVEVVLLEVKIGHFMLGTFNIRKSAAKQFNLLYI